MKHRTGLVLAFALLTAGIYPLAYALTEYEPCHFLCSTEAGRVEREDASGVGLAGRWSLKLETIYVRPTGHYEEHDFVPLADDAQVTVIEFLPTAGYWWTDEVLINAGLPYEINRARNVILPTLHPEEGETHENAAGGVWASINKRFQTALSASGVKGLEPWVGLGYRASSPIGTTDVADDLQTNPDTAIEGLGIGSDDFYTRVALAGASSTGEQLFWISFEERLHMLPRFKRIFGRTSSYAVSTEIPFPYVDRLALTAKLSGFRTVIIPLDVVQQSLLLPSLGLMFRPNQDLSLGVAGSGQVHGTAYNRNTLQTENLHFSVGYNF